MTRPPGAIHAMRRTLTALALLQLVLATSGCGLREVASRGDSFRVMTFNIRVDAESDGRNAWVLRREAVRRLLVGHDPDLIGFQEVLPRQLRDLLTMLPDHAYAGSGRRASGVGEHTAIFYHKRRFALVDSGMFWLSETPDTPGTKGWDAAVARSATWCLLRDRRTDALILHVNTHLDHRGEQARVESAEVLRRKLADLAPPGAAVILTGDFNATPDSEIYARVTADLHDARERSLTTPSGPASTWNGFREVEPGRRIDFIFVGDGVDVLAHATFGERIGKRWPSDHLPVTADLRVAGR